MRVEKRWSLKLRTHCETHRIDLHMIKYSDTITVTGLVINSLKYWLLREGGKYRMISDFPMSQQLKERIVMEVERISVNGG